MPIYYSLSIGSAFDDTDEMEEASVMMEARAFPTIMPNLRFFVTVDTKLLEDSQDLRRIGAITSSREV